MTTTMGYLPPYAALEAGLAFSEDGAKVTMSRELFQQFLEVAAKAATFDDIWYRTEYADVAEAIEAGYLENELDHFVRSGYQEGRSLAYFEVEEEWYLSVYPDVARAIAAGDVLDAESHFNDAGYREGRASDEAMEAEVRRWDQAIAASAAVLAGSARAEPDPSAGAEVEPAAEPAAGAEASPDAASTDEDPARPDA